MSWLGNIFPNISFQGQQPFNPVMPTSAPNDGRTQYTGGLGSTYNGQPGMTGSAFSDAGDPNNYGRNAAPGDPTWGGGPQLGPSGQRSDGGWNGPVPMGGLNQLGRPVVNDFSGYYPPGQVFGTQVSAGTPQNANYVSPSAQQGRPQATPKPHEPPPAQPMMGQWGGGGWNVGGGAPASMQPMWLGSMNGGKSWGQAPGYNATAPKTGQSTPMWSQTTQQDPDSMTWTQGGR